MSLNHIELDPDKVEKKISKNLVASNALLIPTKKNPIKIHPDSPKTIEACKELGVEHDYFKIKFHFLKVSSKLKMLHY